MKIPYPVNKMWLDSLEKLDKTFAGHKRTSLPPLLIKTGQLPLNTPQLPQWVTTAKETGWHSVRAKTSTWIWIWRQETSRHPKCSRARSMAEENVSSKRFSHTVPPNLWWKCHHEISSSLNNTAQLNISDPSATSRPSITVELCHLPPLFHLPLVLAW